MAVDSTALTHWSGDLESGWGRTVLATSGAAEFDVNWQARSKGSDATTTPEELLAAAHASCYSMALSKTLADGGTPPESLDVKATVTFVPGTGITGSKLSVTATVPGLDSDAFEEIARAVKDGCPVSQALASIELTLEDVILT
ncbi:MAG: peroxiredoxin [Actinobacteria bacterium HGW-Actinobacteria-4]|nr:MAG: peroxiredoxin [Actinobacteria bacterium HGW-Actinobacteria-4]